FAVLSLSQLFHAFNMRSAHSLFRIGTFTNRKLCLAFLLCAFLQIAVISVPSLADIFRVVPLTPLQWLITFILSALPIGIIELQKKISGEA
ncbi:MAG TPA: cation transporting ATPase C-terminal domain-containing protein, partial [Candidatus Caccomorpha excrementavium]|nr:cation transporting ATPase C-terminal domain-containing protein [Candidatus Caccomorpha excrementavium]